MSAGNRKRSRTRNQRATGAAGLLFAVAGALNGLAAFDVRAGGTAAEVWPFNGMMPNVGAMSYELVLRPSPGQPNLNMTGHASAKGGMVRWVHCLQPAFSPLRLCQLMLNGAKSETFVLPAQIDLARWLTESSGLGWIDRMVPDFGPRISFTTSGTFSWGVWQAKGRFRYAR